MLSNHTTLRWCVNHFLAQSEHHPQTEVKNEQKQKDAHKMMQLSTAADGEDNGVRSRRTQ